MFGAVVQIIRQIEAADIYRLGIGIENFEVILAGSRIGHPFINPELRRVTKRGDDVLAAKRRNVEDPVRAAIRNAAD